MAEAGRATARRAADAVARRSYGRLSALLAARTRDAADAEDALSDAFASALVDWPASGVPRNPEAWLLTVARRKWIDATRRSRSARDGAGHLRLLAEESEAAAIETGPIPDERLALMFACAHPALDPGVRAPLILQTVLGLDAATIGKAFLVPAATMGQRLVRAKRKIRTARIPLEMPDGRAPGERLAAVLEALYTAFGVGESDPGASDARRGHLADEGIRLGRLVTSLLPDEPEALGLLSLMLYTRARRRARCNAAGEYVPLAEQDPALWDARQMDEAESLLSRARRLDGTGRYPLEAAVHSAHAVRRSADRPRPDWETLVRLYDALWARTGSLAIAVDRAVAVAEARGPASGLAALDALQPERCLADHPPYWAARAELLARAGDVAGAEAAYGRSIGLEGDRAVRRYLERRRGALRHGR